MNEMKVNIIDFCKKYDIFSLAQKTNRKQHEYTEEEIEALGDWNELKIYLTHLLNDLYPLFRSKHGRMRTKNKDSDKPLNDIVRPIEEELYTLIDIADDETSKMFKNK